MYVCTLPGTVCMSVSSLVQWKDQFPATGGVCVIVLPPCGIMCGAHVPLLHGQVGLIFLIRYTVMMLQMQAMSHSDGSLHSSEHLHSVGRFVFAS